MKWYVYVETKKLIVFWRIKYVLMIHLFESESSVPDFVRNKAAEWKFWSLQLPSFSGDGKENATDGK